MLNLRTRSILAVYVSGFISGMALIMYPAGGSLFQDSDFHDLSSGQFGSIFIVQTSMAVLSSLLTARLIQGLGAKYAYLLGQAIVVVSMLFLASTQLLLATSGAPYAIILLSAGLTGLGFGVVLSASNVYAYDFFPGQEDVAITAAQIIISFGLVIGAPLLGQFITIGLWWGGPLLIGGMLVLMIAFELTMPLKLASELAPEPQNSKAKLTFRLALYTVIAFLYGASEATFSNWSTTLLDIDRGYSTSQASVGLSVFWLSIVMGRVVFIVMVRRINTKFFYTLSPALIALSFVILPLPNVLGLSYLALMLAGFSCSFFLPYSITLASAEYRSHTAFVSGVMIAALQFGIGVSTVSVGAINDAGILSLAGLLTFSAFYGVVMVIIVLYLNYAKTQQMIVQYDVVTGKSA